MSFYEQLLEKLEKTVKTWKSRSISLLGKVLFVNSKLLSKIWYLAYLIPFKQDFFDRVSRIVQQFLWGGCRSQIERNLLEQPKGFGLGLIDPKHQFTAFLASWIQRIHNAQREGIPPPWYHLATHILTKHYIPNQLGLEILTTDYGKQKLMRKDGIWLSIYHAWRIMRA
ncbi:uncharacterized protein VTP21DRAFT_10262 [Calcarisporiella thermophila]|uniref:uncharacterized protein n=1 Tax=Calcarisporiella thermophila TaxID=911321 RepID=UPI00374307BE